MPSLFGGNDNMKQVGEDMQKLSEQIAALQQQLRQKTSEADGLRTQAAQNAGAAVALEDAEAQMQVLRNQLNEMRNQSANSASSAELDAAHAQIQALQNQLSALQQSANHTKPVGGVSVGAAATSTGITAGASTGGLTAGASAWVTRAGGLPLRLRSGPSLDQSVIDRLQPGTKMTLLDGPQQADGHAWWHIRTDNGKEGWVAGEDLRTQPD